MLRIAAEHGYSVSTSDIEDIESESEFIDVVVNVLDGKGNG